MTLHAASGTVQSTQIAEIADRGSPDISPSSPDCPFLDAQNRYNGAMLGDIIKDAIAAGLTRETVCEALGIDYRQYRKLTESHRMQVVTEARETLEQIGRQVPAYLLAKLLRVSSYQLAQLLRDADGVASTSRYVAKHRRPLRWYWAE